MQPKISASLFSLLDHRRYLALLAHEGEVVGCHKGTLIQADMNPNYRGTMQLNAAFKNRFPIKIEWNYDEEVERQLLGSATLLEVAKGLREAQDIRTPVSTNSLMEFEEFATNPVFGLDFAIANFKAGFEEIDIPVLDRVLDLKRTKLDEDVKFLKRNKGKKLAETAADDDSIDDDYDFENED